MDIMHIPGISALAVLLLAGAVTPVMASQGYWTSNSSWPPNGLNIYHIFLVGSYPSSVDYIGYKLVNPHLTACLDFNYNYTNPKPAVCHPIKESEIPLKNDSAIDAGFFVVSDKLNVSAAMACIHIGYRNLYSCGQNSGIDPNIDHAGINKLFYDLSDIYQEARNYDYCIHSHPEDDLNWCMQQVTD